MGRTNYGYICDELIAEIGRRLDLNNVQVEETLAYYSMLHRKPIGKHHVQVCTNIACMLRGGAELLEHAKKRLEIGHKEVTKDGVFSLEEVECIGACTGAPAMQVNYDFYENLTPLKFDRHHRRSRQGQARAAARRDYRRAARTRETGNPADQQEVGHQGFPQNRCLSAERRLPGAGKSAEADDPGIHH